MHCHTCPTALISLGSLEGSASAASSIQTPVDGSQTSPQSISMFMPNYVLFFSSSRTCAYLTDSLHARPFPSSGWEQATQSVECMRCNKSPKLGAPSNKQCALAFKTWHVPRLSHSQHHIHILHTHPTLIVNPYALANSLMQTDARKRPDVFGHALTVLTDESNAGRSAAALPCQLGHTRWTPLDG